MSSDPSNPWVPATTTVTVDLRRRHAALARQRRLLGSLQPVPGFRIGVRWQGADGISGDFYDTWAMPDGRLQVALGDVSGHGVPAALVMASLLKTLRLRRSTAGGPGQLLAALNRDLSGDLAPGDFATLWLVEVGPGGTAIAAAAGHHAAFLVREDGVFRVQVGGPALGLVPDRAFETIAFRMSPGDWLVQCSDGLLEEVDRAGHPFGDEGVAATLERLHAAKEPVEAVPDALATALAAWSGRPPTDDLTIVAVALDGSLQGSDDGVDDESSAARAAIAAWPLPGRRVGSEDGAVDYLLGPAIGSGGAGVVHEAVQSGLGRTVAIKRASRPDRAAALMREGLIAAALEHPNVLPVHEAGRDPGFGPFLALRRPVGTSWRSRMAILGLDRNLEILLAIADAAAAAHRRGIIHRDIKPDNVLLGEDGAAYLFDWGVAAAVPGIEPRLARVVLPPREDQAAGSPAYMAPEMARGEGSRIGPASDVYLLGATLVEILTGRPPHPGAGIDEALEAAAVAGTPAIDPAEPLARVVAAACAPDPAQRPRDAAAFRDLLARCRRDRQALLMVREALRRSDAAGSSLTGHLRALAVAEEALRLCPDEEEIRAAVAGVRAAYARPALAQGDLALAASLIDPALPGHAELAAALEHAREARRRDEDRRRRLEDLDRRLEPTWIPLHQGFGPDWQTLHHAALVEGRFLRATNHPRECAIAPVRFRGDLRIQARLRSQPHHLAQVGCFIAAPTPRFIHHVPDDGYMATIGTDGCTLARGTEVVSRSARRVEPGTVVQIALTRRGNRLTVNIDGSQVIEWTDPSPLGATGDQMGILCVESDTEVLDWQSYRFGRPELEDPVSLAERHLLAGRHQTAIDILTEVAGDGAGDRATRAAALAKQASDDLAMARHFTETAAMVAGRLPGAVLTVAKGRLGLRLTTETGDLGPLRGIPLDELECRVPGRIADLGPLKGMRLRRLHLFNQQVTDLAPVAGHPCIDLGLAGNPLSDIRCLRRMPLERLILIKTGVSDLTPLAGGRLEAVDVSRTPVARLDGLEGQPLIDLWAGNAAITDLGPLAGNPLQRLGITGTGIRDLGPLRGTPLRTLYMDHTAVASLDPLTGSPLRYLNLAFAPVRDLGPLSGLPIEEVVLTGCPVEDVSPMASCPLKRIIYGPVVPRGLDLLPESCVRLYREAPVKPA